MTYIKQPNSLENNHFIIRFLNLMIFDFGTLEFRFTYGRVYTRKHVSTYDCVSVSLSPVKILFSTNINSPSRTRRAWNRQV